ncbi:MAG: hypothetical protein ABSG69_03490 [Candidatus Acidiferrum sp.]
MSVKEKLLVLGVVLVVAVGILGHHYWSCAIQVLQHLVAVSLVGTQL